MPWAIRSSIRSKFTLVVLAATLSALAVAGAALVFYDLRSYQQQWVSDLRTQAEILGRASATALAFDDSKSANENLALLKLRPRVLAGAIYNARGKRVADYHGDGDPQAPLPSLPELDVARAQGDDMVVFQRIVENGEIVGTVYLRANYGARERLYGYLGILGGVMVLSLLVAAGVSTWLQATLTQPLLAVTGVARQVMERRDFSLRVRKTTEDEIGVLVDAFNDMLAELGRRAETIEASNTSLAHEIAERQRADDDLRTLNAELERRVGARTAQLEAANKELESFSYSVSHDLRAPLRGITGFAEALLEDHAAELSEEARRKIDIVQHEGRRMSVLIDELLAFSRLGRKALQSIELNMASLAQATWKDLTSQNEGGAVEFQVGPLPAAQGDRVLLGQVWANLLSNAIKFSAKQAEPCVNVGAITDEKEHIYFVRDNGAGFNPKYQAKLFGVFQRLHDASDYPGTGVGLALVQRIVNRHGGRVWAEGALGQGATFYFSLPREPNDGHV
jgi:signal transduction histidine kinase